MPNRAPLRTLFIVTLNQAVSLQSVPQASTAELDLRDAPDGVARQNAVASVASEWDSTRSFATVGIQLA